MAFFGICWSNRVEQRSGGRLEAQSFQTKWPPDERARRRGLVQTLGVKCRGGQCFGFRLGHGNVHAGEVLTIDITQSWTLCLAAQHPRARILSIHDGGGDSRLRDSRWALSVRSGGHHLVFEWGRVVCGFSTGKCQSFSVSCSGRGSVSTRRGGMYVRGASRQRIMFFLEHRAS